MFSLVENLVGFIMVHIINEFLSQRLSKCRINFRQPLLKSVSHILSDFFYINPSGKQL